MLFVKVKFFMYDTTLFDVEVSSKFEIFWFFCHFSWEGGGTLLQNSYKPSRNLWEATLLRRTRSVQRLARSFGTNKHTDTQTSCYFSMRIKIYKLSGILKLGGDLKSASNFKDFFFIKFFSIILYLKEEMQFKLINFGICDWWI